jgi:hypothetical protein
MIDQTFRSTAALNWRSTSITDLLMCIDICIENHGVAHLYLHGERWMIHGAPHNEYADDQIGTWHLVARDQRSKQHALIERIALRTMNAEVTK